MLPAEVEGFYDGRDVLVTGGAGFIGSHLVERLVQCGARVRIIDDLSTGHREHLPAGADLQVASILDEPALSAAAEGCVIIFHEAAMVSVPESVKDPRRCFEVNGRGTERVLLAARRAGARRVVYAPAAAVFGDAPRLPSREDDPIRCCSPYAASKAAGEALVAAYGRCYEISTVSLRYFNVYGPRQDPDSPYAAVIAAFRAALVRGTAPTIFGDGGQTRDFVVVDDVVRANLLAGAADGLAGEVVNIGSGRRTSLRELLEHLALAMGADPAFTTAPERSGDVRDSQADISRARALIGYEPSVDLAEGLRRLEDAVERRDR